MAYFARGDLASILWLWLLVLVLRLGLLEAVALLDCSTCFHQVQIYALSCLDDWAAFSLAHKNRTLARLDGEVVKRDAGTSGE